MRFTDVDYAIVVVYLIGVALFGILFSGKQKNAQDYFLGSRKVPWWAVCFSIVATETSTLTFISIPGLAYITNMGFLQLAFGYLIGRIIIAFLLIPKYYEGNLDTAYHFLGKRFGEPMRKYSSITFIVIRIFADGVRLFTTAIPIKFITGMSYFECILIVGVITLIYSYLGGVKAVIWTDVVQMFIYFFASVATIYVIYQLLPEGWQSVVKFAAPQNKFQIFNFSVLSIKDFFTGPYNWVGGLLGGAFLSMASHGTDQLIVQRLLTCDTKKSSQKAIIGSGVIVIFQFFIFLLIGVMLYAFYQGSDYHSLSIGNYILQKTDEIFPKFIIEKLPSGIRGIVVAGLLAASMSTLSSAFNSLASTTIFDLFRNKISSPKNQILYSRLATLFWGVVIIGTGLLFVDETNPAVDYALKIQSVLYGGLLGVFLMGIFFKRAGLMEAVVSYTITIATLVAVFLLSQFKVILPLNLTWFTFFGVIICFAITIIILLFKKYFIKQSV